MSCEYNTFNIIKPLKLREMKRLLLILTCLPMIGLGQSKYKLGDYTKFTKNNIEFHLQKPMYPFERSDESLSSQGNKNLVVSFLTNKPSALQIYATPVPAKFQEDAGDFFNSAEQIKSFVDQLYAPPINKVLEYRVVDLNEKKFLEIILISADIQKQINWITIYQNNLINILGTTLIKDFDETLPFIKDFYKSIKIK